MITKDNFDAKIMGKRLKTLRKSKQLTQAQLAEVLNVGYDMIGRYENGKTPLGPDLIVAICNYFGCSTDYLYFGREYEQMNENDMIQKITMLLPRTPDIGMKVVLDMLLVLNKEQSVE